MPVIEPFDAVVIGGNVRGLVTSYVLGSLGYKTLLVERGPSLGGADATFRTRGGSEFEYGMHVLDDSRSEVATRLFCKAVDGEFHKVRLERGIVLRNHLVPYAPTRDEIPDELRRLLPAGELVDDLCDEPPTRERLAGCYGGEYADMIFDEVLPSYPCEARHLQFGVDESRLMTNIYPWFFPSAQYKATAGDESRRFHDKLRTGEEQHILYPKRGGFGGFIEGLASKLDPNFVEVLTGAELRSEVDSATHSLREVTIGDRRVDAPLYFWAGAWPSLCSLLGVECQDPATDRILIGSFRLNREAHSSFHEILVGDPELQISRIYFPARFRESSEPLMQVEFAVPLRGDWPTDPEAWLERWSNDLRRVGILDADHRVEEFDFKTRAMHFNSFGMEGIPLVDADPALLHPNSNVRPVVPSMANLNLNAHVPRTIDYVTSVVAGVRAEGRG